MKTLVTALAAVQLLACAQVRASDGGALARYVAEADASYGWKQRNAGRLGTTSCVELILTSQTWRDIVWKHQLFIVRPASAVDPDHAMLVIGGGNWKAELEGDGPPPELPRSANMFALLAEQMKTPVAVLLQVPHQPIFGRREDQIIALTFDEYLETEDPRMLLLLPMVKSAVRAMDAVQDYAQKQWSMRLKSFTVCGASKRGWTTWLTGAVDSRVTAMAPMVIDMLNMGPQLKHQEQVWGQVSYKIHDYTERDLPRKLNSERGRALQAIVDPYHYRHLLTRPKLIMLGTNDHYWPLDALNLYWKDLPDPKYVLYLPNNRHGLRDFVRLTGSLLALHRHAAEGKPLPKLSWEFTAARGGLELSVRSDPAPQRVQAWVANAEDRDFRDARWASRPTRKEGAAHVFNLAIPKKGHAAVFGEAVYAGETMPYFLSTNVKIVGQGDGSAAQAD